MELKIEIEKKELPDPFYNRQGIGLFRQWFRDAVDYWREWQDAAREDYDFVEGRQWTKNQIRKFEEKGRPALVINRIRPLINLLSGYQRLNRYSIGFAARTDDDVEICRVREGVTKYILDRCDYDTNESNTFTDSAIGGMGWFFVGYKVDEETQDGEAFITREDPFSIYADPESHKADFSDAKYICRAKWVDKEELKNIYPEHSQEIDAQFAIYDSAEYENSVRSGELLWYKRELQKVRVVELWYKRREKQTRFIMSNGEEISESELTPELFFNGFIAGSREVNLPVVRVCVFFDRIILEDMPSPYRHGEFPLVPLPCHYYGIGGDEIPAGIVRDLKDPQREINKRRVQQLNILNHTGNGGYFIEEDAMTEKQFAEFERNGSLPGHAQKVRPTAISQAKIMERPVGQYPAGLAQAEAQATADLTSISGINEALMGVDVPSGASGKAIELKQKQAITHLAVQFDNLRTAKKKIAYLLWGRRGHAGIIPQFYTEDKVYRVEGKNGQEFVHVNQQVIEQDPIAGTVVKTLNDLSHGEFDIVLTDIEATTTQRQSQLWLLVDAISKLGIPGDIAFDMILDLSDLPQKEELKRRWQERQESQAKAAQEDMQMKLQIEQMKNQNSNISFKDAPPVLQIAMAAKAGFIPQEVADRAVQNWIENDFPDLSAEKQQEEFQQMEMQNLPPELQAQLAEIPPEEIDKMTARLQMNQPRQNNQGGNLTQPAIESLIRGITPAM